MWNKESYADLWFSYGLWQAEYTRVKKVLSQIQDIFWYYMKQFHKKKTIFTYRSTELLLWCKRYNLNSVFFSSLFLFVFFSLCYCKLYYIKLYRVCKQCKIIKLAWLIQAAPISWLTRNLEMLVFVEGGKLENLEKTLGGEWEPTTNSTHIGHQAGIRCRAHW